MRTHTFDQPIRRTDFQHVVDLGDIGSTKGLGLTGIDGFDDYAVSFGDGGPYGSSSPFDPWIEIYDGRTGVVLVTLVNPIPAPPGNGWASFMDAGLNIVGDATPDLVVGSPGFGRVDVYDFASAVWKVLPAPTNDWAGHGFIVALLGDVRGMAEPGKDDGYSEVLVTNYLFNDIHGIAYVLDVNDDVLADFIWKTVLPPVPGAWPNFGTGAAVIGDCWPPTGSDGFPEFAIGDYNWGGGNNGGYLIFTWDAATSEFVGLEDVAAGLPLQEWGSIPNSLDTGKWLAAGGDCDNNPDSGDASWDLLSASGDGSAPSNARFHVRGRDLTQPIAQNFVSWGRGFADPAAEPAHWVNFARAPNVVGAGDVNLDGFDDILLARGGPCSSFDAVFSLFSGQNQPSSAPALLWEKDRHGGKLLWGSPYGLPGALYAPTRNFVANLGDVDGDGVEDFAIATGVERNGNAACDSSPTPDRGLLLIYSPSPSILPGGSPPLLPAYAPGIRGNLAAQADRHVFIQAHNLMPGDKVWIYDAPSLQPPFDINNCGTPLEVYPSRSGPYIADAFGEVAAILPVPAASVGSKWYYQVWVENNPGPPTLTCRASATREVLLIDLSNPRWSLPR